MKDIIKGINGRVSFDEDWYSRNFGSVVYIDPMEDSVAAAKQRMTISVNRQKGLKKRFPDLPIGNSIPYWKLHVQNILWYDPRRLFCVVYGAPRPQYIRGIYWHSREKLAWDWVETVKDVESIKVPLWQDEPEMKAMLKQRAALEKAFPGKKISISEPRARWRNLTFIHYPNFIDMAPLLLGNTYFFRVLISEPDLAHALMEKCFEISVSFTDFETSVDGITIDDAHYGVSSLGGDYSSTLSPKLFAKYANTWNRGILNHFKKIANRSGDPPCSIHSCGPSTHLYEEFSKIPNVKFIDTRGVMEGIKKLREVLPNTHLNITLAPPQVNFEKLSHKDVKSILWKFAEGAIFRDVSFTAICTAGTPDENVRAFYQTLQEIIDSA